MFVKARWRRPGFGQRMLHALPYLLAVLVPLAVVAAGFPITGFVLYFVCITLVGGKAVWRTRGQSGARIGRASTATAAAGRTRPSSGCARRRPGAGDDSGRSERLRPP